MSIYYPPSQEVQVEVLLVVQVKVTVMTAEIAAAVNNRRNFQYTNAARMPSSMDKNEIKGLTQIQGTMSESSTFRKDYL